MQRAFAFYTTNYFPLAAALELGGALYWPPPSEMSRLSWV